jgi:glycosyltransferase involved in cell wall biosynthesis
LVAVSARIIASTKRSMHRRIRVLHLIDSFDLGGGQTVIYQFLKHRDRGKLDLVLAACHGNGRSVFLPKMQELGCEVICLSPFKWLPVYCFTLPWLIASRRFDVVHCHLFVSNWTGKILAKLFRVPVIISHDHSYDRFRFEWPLVRWWDGLSNRCADAIFVISTYIKDSLVRREKILAGKIYVLKNAVAPPPAIIRRPKPKLIGAAGRLVDWKNFSRFLKLAAHLSKLDPDYRFILAGDGPLAADLKVQAQELGLGDRILWPGVVPNLEGFYAEIALLVLTSDWEDLPMVVLEAFSHRVPTAIVGNNPERNRLNNEALLLAPEADVARWAEAVHSLLGSPERLEEMCAAAQRLMEEEFSPQRQMRWIEDKYEELLRVKGGGG